jgi:ABC-type microcin C transport system permease subunit YejB
MVALLSHRPGQGAVEFTFSNSLIKLCLSHPFAGLFLAWIAMALQIFNQLSMATKVHTISEMLKLFVEGGRARGFSI